MKRFCSYFGGMPSWLGNEPYLEQVEGLGGGGIHLAVAHAGTRRHVLELAGNQRLADAGAVLVLHRSFEDVGEDLHVAVGMLAEARRGRDAVLVDDAQGAEAHVRGIVVLVKREAEVGVEPTVVGMAALGGRPYRHHCIHPGYSDAPGCASDASGCVLHNPSRSARQPMSRRNCIPSKEIPLERGVGLAEGVLQRRSRGGGAGAGDGGDAEDAPTRGDDCAVFGGGAGVEDDGVRVAVPNRGLLMGRPLTDIAGIASAGRDDADAGAGPHRMASCSAVPSMAASKRSTMSV